MCWWAIQLCAASGMSGRKNHSAVTASPEVQKLLLSQLECGCLYCQKGTVCCFILLKLFFPPFLPSITFISHRSHMPLLEVLADVLTFSALIYILRSEQRFGWDQPTHSSAHTHTRFLWIASHFITAVRVHCWGNATKKGRKSGCYW